MTRRRNTAGKERPAARRISDEIQQTRPFTTPAREAAVTLLRTSDVLRHAVETALRPWGISAEQYNILRILRGADDQGLPTLEIAERMVSRSPNITRLVDKMVAKGLAERTRPETDRRVIRISATNRARTLLVDLDQAIEAMLARLSALPPKRLRTLITELDALRERLAVPTVRET